VTRDKVLNFMPIGRVKAPGLQIGEKRVNNGRLAVFMWVRHGMQGKVIPIQQGHKLALEQRTDDELMELAAAHVELAFVELLRRWQGRVRSFCLKWGGRGGEDLAQEVFLELWRARQRYQPRGQFPLYLFTIVRNRCRNARRGWFRRPLVDPLPAEVVDSTRSDQLDLVLERERARRVDHQISRLSPPLREALLLRFGQELSYADIALVVGAPEATVRSRVFNGLRRLQQELS